MVDVMLAPPILDPALPTLPLAFDLTALSSRFAELWKGTGGQHFAVSSCMRVDTTYEPGVRCVAAYELTGTSSSEARARTFGVLDVDPSGAAHRVFPDDPELPALSSAANCDAMRQRLGDLPTGVTGLRVVDACEITPVRYKPGQRCVLRYDLRSEGQHAAVFGKLVATGGSELFATLGALHDSGETIPSMPRVPRPLSYWPDLELVIQSPAAGATLTARALDAPSSAADRAHLMRSAGSGLAALHRGPTGTCGPRRTVHDDVRELQGFGGLFRQLAPRLERCFQDAIGVISRDALGSGEPPSVASHGALRTDQFLVDDDHGLVLLDLDGFCRASAARDLGNLLAYLDWRAIRKPEDGVPIAEMQRAFLEGYATIAPLPESSWLAIFRAASMLKIAGRRLQSISFEEWDFVPKLLDQAWQTLPS
jgi:phosphotransferase family enzyme